MLFVLFIIFKFSKFCRKIYLVDPGYPNLEGYSPYKQTKYHLPEFCQVPRPSRKNKLFNFCHSSISVEDEVEDFVAPTIVSNGKEKKN